MLKKIKELVDLMKEVAGYSGTYLITDEYNVSDEAIQFCIDNTIPLTNVFHRQKEYDFCNGLLALPMVYRKAVVDYYICLDNNIKHVIINRGPNKDEGTLGKLKTSTGFSCYTLELPDRNNEPYFSCIPVGVYTCEIIDTPDHGRVYEVKDVDGRTVILFHWGNWAGDVKKGYISDSEGCILVGNDFSTVRQLMVLNSKTTYGRFMDTMNEEPFKLFIVEGI